MTPRFNIHVPSRYKLVDFQDILERIKKENSMKVKNGRIEMRLVMKNFDFRKSGKVFHAFIWGTLDNLYVNISEYEPPI